MSKKRFEFYSDDYVIGVLDTVTGKTLNHFATIDLLNEQQATIQSLKSDKAIAEDYANIFEKENVKLRKKLNNYKATVLGFIWMMEQNGRISGKDDDLVKDLFKLIDGENYE